MRVPSNPFLRIEDKRRGIGEAVQRMGQAMARAQLAGTEEDALAAVDELAHEVDVINGLTSDLAWLTPDFKRQLRQVGDELEHEEDWTRQC